MRRSNLPFTLPGLTLVTFLSFQAEIAVAQERVREVFIDVEKNLRVESKSVSAEGLPLSSPLRSTPPWRVIKDVLHGGRQEGVDIIRVDNGVFNFALVPTRGLNLWDGRVGDLRLGWDSPVQEIVHPYHVNLTERGGLGWLEGFSEWINRCGLASNGAAGEDRVPSNTGAIVPVNLTLHGKVSYLPARRAEVEVEPGTGGKAVIRVRGVVDETMMFGTQLRLAAEVATEAGSRSLTITDEVRNMAATEQEFQMLYHANFGTPLLGEGASFVAPLERVTPRDARAAEGGMEGWDRYGAPTTGYLEQVYFLKPRAGDDGMTEVLLRNKVGNRGVTMAFSVRELPYLTLWKNTSALENGYVTGIEPATNYPNNRSFERRNGRVPVLKGGGSWRATIHITALLDAPAVAAAEARIRKLQGAAAPTIDRQPAPGLCP
jgi:hypothetical protein